MKRLVVYVHGKGGNAEEAEHFQPFFEDSDVIGFDYQSQTPWDAKEEFSRFFRNQRKKYDSIVLIANSIGAYFSMSALSREEVEKAYFISPIVNMEKLIMDIMSWANVSNEELCVRKEIPTAFGETLSWESLRYVREHPIVWDVPSLILYGENDRLTSKETVSEFAERVGARLTVMKNGEHWFHTEEQMKFLDGWIKRSI